MTNIYRAALGKREIIMTKSFLCLNLFFSLIPVILSNVAIGAKNSPSSSFIPQVIIQKGTVFTVPEGKKNIYAEELIMQDNSTFIIPSAIEEFEFNTKKSYFGKNTKIIAKGIDATKPGESGTPGVDIIARLGNTTIKGLTIITSGGSGSDGLPGVDGQNGQDASCDTLTHGQDGSSGSNGRRGGNGQNAGLINIYMAKHKNDMNIHFIQKGGKAGKGGMGGKGGKGNPGISGNFRT